MAVRHRRPLGGVRVHELPLRVELGALELVRERVALVRALVRREPDVLVGRRDLAVHAERADVDGPVLGREHLREVDVLLEQVGPLRAVAAELRVQRVARPRHAQVVGRQVLRSRALADAGPERAAALVLVLDLEVRAVVGAAVVAVARLVDADPVVVGLEQAEADLRVRVIRAAVVLVEAGGVDLRLGGEVALGERLAEEGDLPGLGLVDGARAEREDEVAALGPGGAFARRRRRRMAEGPAARVESAVERVGLQQAGPGAVGRAARLRARVDAEPVERRGAAAVAAAEGGETDPQRGLERRRVARLSDERPGRAVVGRELADHVRSVVAGAQEHLGRHHATRSRRDALRDRRADAAVLGDDVLELVVARARADGDELAERVRVLGLPDHEARLLAVGVERARVEPRRHRPLAARRVLQERVRGERVVGDEVALEDRQAEAAVGDLRAVAGGRAPHLPLGVERRAGELVRLRQAGAPAAAGRLDREGHLSGRVLDVARRGRATGTRPCGRPGRGR